MAHEFEAAARWAERHSVPFEWLPVDLQLRLTLVQPETALPFFLRGRFHDYRALPPEWTFTNEKWEGTGRPAHFPKVAHSPFGASIFIMHGQNAVICVPFNRLAYTEHAGPHGDWNGPTSWLNAGSSSIHADTLGDMLQAIHRDFLLSRGYMGNQ